MHWPVILHDPDAFGLRIGLPHFAVKADQGAGGDFANQGRDHLARKRVQGRHDAGHGIVTRFPFSMGRVTTSSFVVVAHAGLPFDAALIQVEQHFSSLALFDPLTQDGDPCELLLVMRVGAVDVAPASLRVNIHPLEDALYPSGGSRLPVGQAGEQVAKPPSTSLKAQFVRVAAHQVQQRFFGAALVPMHRGKKRACALVLCD